MDEHLLEVYLINTARHTEETPVAEWVSLPTDAETMKAVFERLGVDGSDTEQYQVSAFHSSLDGWSEALKPGESLDDLNYLAVLLTQRSDEERDKFAAAAQYGDHAASAADLINLTHNLDCYWLYPTVHNSDDYGHYLIDDLDELELPDAAKRFFDYKSYGREAVKEDRGIFTDYGYVYNNGNDYAEWYKANQVPQEYRLTAQPSPQRDMDELPPGCVLTAKIMSWSIPHRSPIRIRWRTFSFASIWTGRRILPGIAFPCPMSLCCIAASRKRRTIWIAAAIPKCRSFYSRSRPHSRKHRLTLRQWNDH